MIAPLPVINVPLEELNTTELLDILRRPGYGYRLRRSVPRERLIHLIQSHEPPNQEEIAETTLTRLKLEKWIAANWEVINSQLPCKGENRGKCTIYPCSEGRHINCYLSAEGHMV